MAKEDKRYALAHGNPVDGFEFVGPFTTNDEAMEYAERSSRAEWWVIELVPPIEAMTHELVEERVPSEEVDWQTPPGETEHPEVLR